MTPSRLSVLMPFLLFTALLSWALSSPVGSSPDEDFHLVSIWCATGDDDACLYEEGANEATVPAALLEVACYAFDSAESAACQDELDFRGEPDMSTGRGNFYGAYPPIFYAVMSIFVGPDIEASVLAMRAFGALLFSALASVLFLLLPRARRPNLTWSWAVTTVPLGLFVLSSTNPSSWAVAGVGLGWLALAGYFETAGARKVGLGVLFALLTVMAAGSRGDAAAYMVLAIFATVVLQMHRTRRFAIDAILPLAAVVFSVLMFRVSRPAAAVTQGIEPEAGLGAVLARVIPTVLDVPGLWMGMFANRYGLGWLDTTLPSVVGLGALACFLGTLIVAVARADLRKTLVLIGGVIVLWALPTAVLVAADESVGANMQPRYLLPLLLLLAGVVFWAPAGVRIAFGRVQRTLVAVTLAVINAVALHLNIARYVTGFDDLGANLDNGIEWWWAIPVSPMTVWVIGAVSYAGLIVLLIGRRDRADQSGDNPAAPQTAHLDRHEVLR